MLLADIISDVGSGLSRTDIDSLIKRWIQQSVDYVYGLLPYRVLERTTSGNMTIEREIIALPVDYGTFISFGYTPGDGTGYHLDQLSPVRFFEKYTDQNIETYPEYFCIYGNAIHIYPLPAAAYSWTLQYKIASPSTYQHNISIIDDDDAGSVGVQVYIDEDAYEQGIGKLYFVSPTNVNGIARIATIDGHSHDVVIYDSDDAATIGVPWHFDEDASDAEKRNLFVSPTGIDCIVQVNIARTHSHYIKFTDDPLAASSGAAINFDEDATVKTQRLRFVSPTDANGTSETVASSDNILPPFIEQYHEVVLLLALRKGYTWKKDWEAVNSLRIPIQELLESVKRTEQRKGTDVIRAKPHTSREESVWDHLRYPEIDD